MTNGSDLTACCLWVCLCSDVSLRQELAPMTPHFRMVVRMATIARVMATQADNLHQSTHMYESMWGLTLT